MLPELKRDMRVLLVQPGFPYRGRDLFPIGLGYLAANIEDIAKIHVIDEQVEGFTEEKLKAIGPDIVGITATTPSFERAKEIIGVIRKTAPETLIVMGGTHVTFRYEEALKEGADVVVRGEGEKSFREIVNGRNLEEIQGISYTDGRDIYQTDERDFIKNLDCLPFPAWKYFPVESYGIMGLVSSRGCTYNCSYCSATRFWKRRVRMRSPENVVEEVNRISEMGFKLVRFMDSTFTLDKERAIKISELIEKADLGIKFSIETRADHIDDKVLIALKRAGLNLICIGVDSGSQEVLNASSRKINTKKITDAFHKIHAHGIDIRAYVTFGFPGETEEGVKKTIELLEQTRPEQILLSLATIYPGTELEKGKRIEIHSNWVQQFGGHGCGGELYFPETLTKRQYTKLGNYMYKEIKRLNREIKSEKHGLKT